MFVVFGVMLCYTLVHRSFVVGNFGKVTCIDPTRTDTSVLSSWAASQYFNDERHEFISLIGKYYILPKTDAILFSDASQITPTKLGFTVLTIKQRLPIPDGVLLYEN
jgi:hypothetical protein